MSRRYLLAIAPAAIAIGFAAAAAQAQDRPGPASPAAMQAMHDAHERQRVQDLKIVLRLRPDQEAALSALMAAHDRPTPGDRMEKHREMGEAKALTTPERLDRMGKRDAERSQRTEGARRALTTFYATLSADQKQVFDALMRLHGPEGGMGGGMGGGMHGGMHGTHAMMGGPGGDHMGEPPR
ncbi:Spy/CpxP family protein refolding chaperone [Phenylobacterium sp.]|uniref:Spy/CpxP family protein refolding chaperone n=1 Tax=Phenylobacterium sp. TaxID=1871053 RepID=UPI002735B8C7|nr:Spy/CpxP family protein refolding chaperone [Phenylobacterium sp.]MDP3661069.1 Spy/CpxP family protein refolding chaperone [Phenylobacterium sp.]